MLSIAIFALTGVEDMIFDRIENYCDDAVTSMASSSKYIAIGSDSGLITFLDAITLNRIGAMNKCSFPTTSIAVRGDTMIAGYSNGTIVIYNIRDSCTRVEIAAHARCISGLALHPKSDVFVTIGHDTMMNVFSLPSLTDDDDDTYNVSTLIMTIVLVIIRFHLY